MTQIMFIKVPHYATYEIKYFGLIYLGWQLLRFQYGNSPVLNRSANQETRLSLRTYILIKQWVFITFVNWIIYQLIEIFVNKWWIQNSFWVCLQSWLIIVQVLIKYNSVYGSIFRFFIHSEIFHFILYSQIEFRNIPLSQMVKPNHLVVRPGMILERSPSYQK